jgi:hypothetical protein
MTITISSDGIATAPIRVEGLPPGLYDLQDTGQDGDIWFLVTLRTGGAWAAELPAYQAEWLALEGRRVEVMRGEILEFVCPSKTSVVNIVPIEEYSDQDDISRVGIE